MTAKAIATEVWVLFGGAAIVAIARKAWAAGRARAEAWAAARQAAFRDRWNAYERARRSYLAAVAASDWNQAAKAHGWVLDAARAARAA